MSALAALIATSLASFESKEVSTMTLSGGKKGYFLAHYVVPQLNQNTPVAKFANAFALNYAKKHQAEFLKNSTEFAKDQGKPTNQWNSELTGEFSVKRNDLVTLVLYHYEYAGGAHPNHWSIKINVGLVNGKPKLLTLKDIIKPGYDPDLVINTYVLPLLERQRVTKGIDWNEPIDPSVYNEFLITPAGITWLFDPYQVGSYAEGDYTVKLINKDLKPESPFLKWVFNN